MKKIPAFCLILFLSACGQSEERLYIEPGVENFVKYIIEDYRYEESGEFVDNYVDNSSLSTNVFLINLLKDSFKEISVESVDETGALLLCDGTPVRIDMTINDGKIKNIKIREGRR